MEVRFHELCETCDFWLYILLVIRTFFVNIKMLTGKFRILRKRYAFFEVDMVLEDNTYTSVQFKCSNDDHMS